MPIEVNCTGCGNRLRVGDEHAGKTAKCPVCETVFAIPTSSTAEPAQAAPVEPSPPTAGHPQSSNPFADNPYVAPSAESAGSPSTLKPHRGGLILTLGILSLVCCNLVGIGAWLMAREDIAQMDRGLMDPSGRGMTQAGMVIGIVALVLMVVVIVFQTIFMVIGMGFS